MTGKQELRELLGKLDAMDLPTDPCVSLMRDVIANMLARLIAELPAAGPPVARATPSPTRGAAVELPPLTVAYEANDVGYYAKADADALIDTLKSRIAQLEGK